MLHFLGSLIFVLLYLISVANYRYGLNGYKPLDKVGAFFAGVVNRTINIGIIYLAFKLFYQ